MPEQVPISTTTPAISPKRFVLKRATDSAFIDESRFKVRYEQELNAAQFEAVKHRDGPALVIAGAGTGKTRTLTYRVARLVEQGIDPKSILLLTFTRRAAQEMLRRASALLHDRSAENVAGGTFHSFANLTLRHYASLIGFNNDFTILDQGDSHDAINLLRTQMGLATARRRFPRKTTLGAMFSLAVNKLIALEDVIENDFPHFIEDTPDILRLWHGYHAYKRKSDAMDYDDLLTNLVLLLANNEKVRQTLNQRYRYIMVDEYQDVNRLQARVVELLAGSDPSRVNVMVVGDDAQSIYRFRGAEVENIFEFPKQYPGAKVIPLEENFRSTQPILTLTNHIISMAVKRYEKTLYSRHELGELPQIVCAENEAQQSLYVVEKILEYREMGVSLKDIAVLFRSGYMSFDLELELQRANIPFQKFGGMKFIETSHVKDLTAMLRVIQNPKDAVSWYRILLLHDGIGPKTAEKIVNDIGDGRVSFGKFREPDEDPSPNLSPERERSKAYVPFEAQKLPHNLVNLFSTLKFVSNEKLTPPEKMEHLIEYYKPILRKKYDDHQKREKDIETFQLITERYRSLTSLLSDLSLDPPTDSMTDVEEGTRDDEILTLSTIHSAKGLEWNTVIITNCLDGRFPSVHAARDPEDLEEERRLMYVAATRAKEHLIITYPTNLYDRESGIVLSKPSRFIDGLVDQQLAEGWIIANNDQDMQAGTDFLDVFGKD